MATTVLESMPPLKKTPRGTSAASGQFPDVLKNGMGGGNVFMGEISRERNPVHVMRHERMLQKRLELRSKKKRPVLPHVVEGFLAHAVARHKQLPLSRVPERKRKHAVQAAEHAFPILEVEVKQHFGIGARSKAVAFAFEFGAQFKEVVNLSVEDNARGAVRTPHGLMPSLEINDAEAPMSQRYVLVQIETAVVGPAMAEHVTHGAQRLLRLMPRGRGISADPACNAAHFIS
jgi:hypothetical protein